MILLDTNVLSDLMKDVPDAAVVRWMNAKAPDDIWISAITVFEIRFGLARLPNGRRRRGLESAFDAVMGDFNGRVAVVDGAAAEAAGVLAATREAAGRSVDFRDTLIAGVAISRGAAIATRNVRHFEDLPIPVLNPAA